MPVRKRIIAKKQANKIPLWLWIFFGLLATTSICVGSAFGILLGFQYNLPRIQSLEDYTPDVITDVYSDDNKVIHEFAIERRIIAAYEEIPPYLRLAILAAEDDQFYNHSGVVYTSLVRAAYKDIIRLSKSEGASTITQQLARMLMQSYEKTFTRKIKELLIAWKIEEQYSKQQILTLYCNQHIMGPGIYGVAAAADSYFGKELKDLTLEECAMIAALPRNPTLYSPRSYPDKAIIRRNYILDRMADEHMISQELADATKIKPLIIEQSRRDDQDMAPYFVEWVRQFLSERFSTDAIWRKGLRVYTTLNIDMQKAANRALREGLRTYDKKHGWRGPIENILEDPSTSLDAYSRRDWRTFLHPGDIAVGLVESVGDANATVRVGNYRGNLGPEEIAWTNAKTPDQILKPGDLAYFQITALDEAGNTASLQLEQLPEVQGALITIENRTGEIKAMVGGYDYGLSEFNRATQAMRQVGSTFKPLVYATAFENGMTPDDTVIDAPVSFTDDLGRPWEPENYDEEYKGAITIRQALSESRNIPTALVAEVIGPQKILVMARRFGFSGPLYPYLSLALGACEATPLEMASAFTVFPNLGRRFKPYYIRRVEDYDHVEKEENEPQTDIVMHPEIAGQVLDLLQNVVQNGTAQSAKSLGYPVGGKTGTTNEFTDAWFVGFSPSITTAVWVGYDMKKTLGQKESGAVAALPIWIDYMAEVLKDRPREQFPSVEIMDQVSPEAPISRQLVQKKLFVEELTIDAITSKPENSEKP